jgi:DNA-binding transcriptional ArsR family regulator
MRQSDVFRALSDPTRLKLVKILLKGERCACELPALVGKAQPTVSLQLKKLASAGVLSCRKEGTKSIYSVSDRRIPKLLEVLS